MNVYLKREKGSITLIYHNHKIFFDHTITVGNGLFGVLKLYLLLIVAYHNLHDRLGYPQ